MFPFVTNIIHLAHYIYKFTFFFFFHQISTCIHGPPDISVSESVSNFEAIKT